MALMITTLPPYYTAVKTFTRPSDTNAYAAGDLVANSVTAGSVVAMSWIMPMRGGMHSLGGVRLRKSGNTATNASFRVHIFAVVPTVANGDNGAFAPTQTANYLGNASVTLIGGNDGSIGIGMNTVPIGFPIALVDRTVYGLLEATAAYTPASDEVFSVQLILS